jgi:sugar/nucleoside kinase (ribokinase family)
MPHSDLSFDLVAIGNAMVDVLSHADEEFLEKQLELHGMKKGSMNLIDAARAEELYSEMGPAVESSGGSAGNTMAGFASFGGIGGYIGKVAADQLGDVFRHDMKAMKVHYDTQPLIVGAPTGRCLILVTPDGERTMNTFLGAGVELSPDDIEEDLIKSSKITYLEGYLFDPPQAKESYIYASQLAHSAGNKVALTLSDPFCVERHREDFQNIVSEHVDILFANEQEIISLYQSDSFEDAVEKVKNLCEVIVLTRSELGSVILYEGNQTAVEAEKVNVVDSTGAGDQYAAGFLYGYTRNMPIEICGKLGTVAASEVISHMGPRPEVSYASLIDKAAAA